MKPSTVIVTLMLSTGAYGQTVISSCGSYGSGDYVMDSDLLPDTPASACLTFTAGPFTLDCRNHAIAFNTVTNNGSGIDVGVSPTGISAGATNSSITGCYITSVPSTQSVNAIRVLGYGGSATPGVGPNLIISNVHAIRSATSTGSMAITVFRASAILPSNGVQILNSEINGSVTTLEVNNFIFQGNTVRSSGVDANGLSVNTVGATNNDISVVGNNFFGSNDPDFGYAFNAIGVNASLRAIIKGNKINSGFAYCGINLSQSDTAIIDQNTIIGGTTIVPGGFLFGGICLPGITISGTIQNNNTSESLGVGFNGDQSTQFDNNTFSGNTWCSSQASETVPSFSLPIYELGFGTGNHIGNDSSYCGTTILRYPNLCGSLSDCGASPVRITDDLGNKFTGTTPDNYPLIPVVSSTAPHFATPTGACVISGCGFPGPVAPGTQITISWSITGSSPINVIVNPGGFFIPETPVGSQIVTASTSTRFNLRAANSFGFDTAFLDVPVQGGGLLSCSPGSTIVVNGISGTGAGTYTLNSDIPCNISFVNVTGNLTLDCQHHTIRDTVNLSGVPLTISASSGKWHITGCNLVTSGSVFANISNFSGTSSKYLLLDNLCIGSSAAWNSSTMLCDGDNSIGGSGRFDIYNSDWTKFINSTLNGTILLHGDSSINNTLVDNVTINTADSSLAFSYFIGTTGTNNTIQNSRIVSGIGVIPAIGVTTDDPIATIEQTGSKILNNNISGSWYDLAIEPSGVQTNLVVSGNVINSLPRSSIGPQGGIGGFDVHQTSWNTGSITGNQINTVGLPLYITVDKDFHDVSFVSNTANRIFASSTEVQGQSSGIIGIYTPLTPSGTISNNHFSNNLFNSGSFTRFGPDFSLSAAYPPTPDPAIIDDGGNTCVTSTTQFISSTSGLNDATFGGTNTGTATTSRFCVMIQSISPDKFGWGFGSVSCPGTASTSNVTITGSAQTLANGVTVTFAATTGHSVGDSWLYQVNPLNYPLTCH